MPRDRAKPDQAAPAELKNPLHLVTSSLTFNQKTGIAQTDELVNFQTEQASGSAKGAYYDSKQNELQLKSDIHIVTTGDHPAVITGTSGVIQKDPRQAMLTNARIEQPDRTLTADKGRCCSRRTTPCSTSLPRAMSTSQSRGPSVIDVYGPRGDLNMGPKNSVQQAIVSGGARFDTQGSSVAHGSADTFIVDFEGKNQASQFHMVKNARMKQDPQPGKSGIERPADGDCRRPARFPTGRRQPAEDRRHRRQSADHDSADAAGLEAGEEPPSRVRRWAAATPPPWLQPASSTPPSTATIAFKRCTAGRIRESCRPRRVSPTRPASPTSWT